MVARMNPEEIGVAAIVVVLRFAFDCRRRLVQMFSSVVGRRGRGGSRR